MEINEFFRILDAIRFDDSIDEQNPELREYARKYYPVLRKLYNMLTETGLISESVNESHGQKKHNSPKDALSAVRKGNREAERDIYGDGFKSKTKLHKTSKKDKKIKINKDNYGEFIDENHVKINSKDLHSLIAECIVKHLNEDYNVSINGDYDIAPDNEFGDNYPGVEVNWGKNIESLISQLEEKFASVIAPEEDEYGISKTPLHDLIMHLKYYYEHNTFDNACFNAIYHMLDKYDFTSNEDVMDILKQLKKYC